MEGDYQPQNNIPAVQFYTAEVIDFVQKDESFNDTNIKYQYTKVKILDGSEKEKQVEIKHNDAYAFSDQKKVKRGEVVILTKTTSPLGDTYYISDKYRIPNLFFIFGFFFLLVVVFGKLKGLTSLLGLALSIGILTQFIIPNIISGNNPFLTLIIGAVLICISSIYLSHGVNKRTSIALLSTLITLGLTILISTIFVKFSRLYGMGSEAAFFLTMGPLERINLEGLLLGGIIIGTLGILDDVTTSLSASIDELKKANPASTFKDLYQGGISIGREHIASLVNTLVLAYAGASLPLFLLFTINKDQPFLITLNSEFFAEEIIRTLVGSSSLILAVPITTAIAAYYFSKKSKKR